MKRLLILSLTLIASQAHAAVFERICSINEDDNTKTLFLRTKNAVFRAIFEMNARDPQRAELTDLKQEFSADHRQETYKGHLKDNVFGPANSKVIIHLDASLRTSAGKTPAEILFKKFIFGRKRYTADCSDWNPVPDARW